MKFYTKFLQITSLESSIYRLKENLILLKFGLWWVGVRTEVSLFRTVFCDRLFRRSSLSLLSVLVKETQNILECWVVSRHVAMSSGRLAETFQIVSTEIQLRVEIGEAWPSVQTVLLWRPDVSKAEASIHWGASGCLQRPVQTVAQEPAVLTWKLHGIFIDIF
jgi:hypothetical protein